MKKRGLTIKLLLVALIAFSFAFSGCSKKEEPLKIYESVEFVSPQVNKGDGGIYPSAENVIKAGSKRATEIYKENEMLFNRDTLKEQIDKGTLQKHFQADSMFGAIPLDTKRIKKDIHIAKNSSGVIFTGLYAPAGEIMSITVPVSLVGNCSVTIGEQSNDILKTDDLTRMPIIKMNFLINSATFKFGTPFGGIITFENSGKVFNNEFDEFDISIAGAVETPYFILGDTKASQIETIMNYGGLSVHLVSGNANIIFWKKDINLKTVKFENALNYWQTVLAFQDSLTAKNLIRNSKMNFFFDDYVSPLKEEDEKCYFKNDYLSNFLNVDYIIENGAMQVFQKLGYFHQEAPLNKGAKAWTLKIDSDVTANAIALITTLEYTTIASSRLETELKDFNELTFYFGAISIAKPHSVLDYDNLSVEQRLSMYAILIHKFGASGIRAILSPFQNEPELASDSELRDKILILCSSELKYDFREFFDYFKFNNSTQAKETVRKMNLKEFYPVANFYSGKTIHLKDDGKKIIDFQSATISLYGDKKIGTPKIVNKNNEYLKVSKYVYELTPIINSKQLNKQDNFYVDVEIAGETERLKGSVSYVSTSATNEYFNYPQFPVYNGKSYTQDDALKTVGKSFVEYRATTIYLAIIIAASLSVAITILVFIIAGVKYHKRNKKLEELES